MAESDAIKALQRQIEQLQTLINVKKTPVSTSSGGLPESKHLDGRNYADWKFLMKNFLVDAGLWDCIEGNDIDPELDKRALAKINLSIKPIASAETRRAKTAKEAWLSLQRTYEDNGVVRRIALYGSLFRTKYEEFPSMTAYIDHITSIAEQLENIGKPLENETVGGIILGGLPEKFRPLILGIPGSNQSITIEFVKNLLLQENIKDLCSTSSDSALYGKSVNKFSQKRKTKDHRKSRCYNCNEFGHFSSSCVKPKRNTMKHKNEAQSKPCSLFTSSESNEMRPTDWYVDSGCNNHMTPRGDWIMDLKPEVNRNIDVANGNSVPATGIGDVEIQLANNHTVKANDVIHAPELTTNLLSVSQIVKKGKSVVFDKEGCKITESMIEIPRKLIFATASESNGLYKLDTLQLKASVAALNSHDVWHRRLAHLNRRDMKLLITKMSTGISCDPDPKEPCITCVKGKQHRQPFPQASKNRSKKILELIHSDLCGPMSTISTGGSRYFLTFTDDFSRKSFVYFLKTKDQVKEKFLEFKALVENQTGKRIKTLRSDNGGEYVNNDLQQHLKLSGIRHETTVPRSPEQNGVAERLNRTLVEKARTMLIDSGLPREHWAEAVNTANYLKNRSPTKAIKFKTPEEVWSKRKPDLSHLRIFGCKVMVHVADPLRKKWDDKSEEGIFIGYAENSKGYRVFKTVTRKVIISRDVIFLENEMMKNAQPSADVTTDETRETNKDEIEEKVTYIDKHEEETDDETKEEMEECHSRYPKRTVIPNSKYFNDDYIVYQASLLDAQDPETYEEAMRRPEADKWKIAVEDEINAHLANNSWTYCDLPSDKKPIKSRWIFKTKYKASGEVERYKARLVAKGCSQKYGIDYEETFSPTIRQSSIRYLLSLAVKNDLKLFQMDVETAFLHPDLDEEIYMELPSETECFPNRYCRLNKSIYGLKQASRVWYKKLSDCLIKMDLQRSKVDPCIFFNIKTKQFLIVAVYVDDLLIITNDKKDKDELFQKLKTQFRMKDLGEAHYILGLNIVQDKASITIDQTKFIKDVLKRFGLEDCKGTSTPLTLQNNLSKDMCPTSEEERKFMENVPYREAVGSLLYIAQCTRPDIAHAVGLLSRFSNNPGKAHWIAVKRVFRYLKGTLTKKLQFCKNEDSLCGYCDSDWANNKDDRRSTTGYIFINAGGAISWNSKRQPTVALSTTEAEYMAISSATQELLWLKHLQDELERPKNKEITLHCDNRGAICISKNPINSRRVKHVDIRHHFVREKIEEGLMTIRYVESENNLADCLTKALSAVRLSDTSKLFGLS